MEQPSSTGILNYVLKSVGLFGFRRYGRPDPDRNVFRRAHRGIVFSSFALDFVRYH